MPAAARFVITHDTLTPGLRRFPAVLVTRLTALAAFYADRAEAQMKNDAPWTDRTGAARQQLGADSRVTATQMEIVLFHGVDYGIWLEVRWSGRYAVIIPTLDSVGPEVMAALRTLLR